MKWQWSIILLLACNVIAWRQIIILTRSAPPSFYFLDVGQGDSELLQFGSVQILIDGGPPNDKVLVGLERALSPNDRYIDLVILTHPHLDHFGGLTHVMRRYTIGKFITAGTTSATPAYADLPTPDITLKEGDTITYGDYVLSLLAPNPTEKNDTDPNKASIVIFLTGPDTSILYMGDAHADNEDRLRRTYKLKADVLKIGHHGSRFSSSIKFLNEVKPKITIIEVGKNSYGHPTPAVIERLKAVDARNYTTREHGTIKIVPTDGRLKVFTER